MQDKWNQFVFELIEARKKDVVEDVYHKMVEHQLEILGWAKWKEEICHKPNIPIGNGNHIQPDILVRRDGEDMFVVEVKRPGHTRSKKDMEQLQSYMRQAQRPRVTGKDGATYSL